MSTLRLNKLAVQRIRQIIDQNGGSHMTANYADSDQQVGPFAPIMNVHIPIPTPHGTEMFEIIGVVPVQVCSLVRQDGRLMAHIDYRLEGNARWAYNFDLDLAQFHVMQEMADDPTREEWTVAFEIRGR